MTFVALDDKRLGGPIAVAGSYREGFGTDIVVATVKGRATGEAWSPLLFTGHSYVEPEDRGAHVIDILKDRARGREEAKAAKAESKEQAKVDELDADARLVVAYVLTHPQCTVTVARTNALAGNARRWAPPWRASAPRWSRRRPARAWLAASPRRS